MSYSLLVWIEARVCSALLYSSRALLECVLELGSGVQAVCVLGTATHGFAPHRRVTAGGIAGLGGVSVSLAKPAA